VPSGIVEFEAHAAAATKNKLAQIKIRFKTFPQTLDFSSIRRSARPLALPAFLSPPVPPNWDAAASLPNCKLPVLAVHSTADGFFPVEMAREIVSLCGGNSELLLLHSMGHNEPFYKPYLSYWGPIISRITG
jgi:pimeloyl-ACP methyl ester carboxylesterase